MPSASASRPTITVPPLRVRALNRLGNLKKRSTTTRTRTRTRPPEPESVSQVRGSKHDSDEPEEPDEPTTLIRKKRKRRRRAVDKETQSPSESDQVTIIKTKKNVATRTRTATASDLYYSCNVDGVSEVQIADAVQSINYSIDNFITNILDGVKSKLSYHKTSPRKRRRRDIPTEPSTGTLRQYLLESRLSASDRDLVADFILHDLVSSLVHKHFFKGGTFFGVGKETLHEDLETMFSKLVADEKSDPIAVQRWRSMSVEAVFQMNDKVESRLDDELTTELERMLKDAFPLTGRLTRDRSEVKPESIYESIIHGERKSLLDIIHQARKLSFMIQHKIVTCQLLITFTPAEHESSDGSTSINDVLGTYAFGLQRILGSERSILIKTKIITRELLQSICSSG